MAVLQSSMPDPNSQKSSSKSKKDTLLLAQDLNYARNLAANEEKVRRRSLKYLKKYLEQRSKASPLTEESLQVLWKGLFYSMWMSDKPLVQEECAENISQLIHCLQFNEALHFFKIGLVTLQNEWFGIDQLRLDKFLMFVRRLLRQALFVLKKTNFKKKANEAFATKLEETILSTTQDVPLGLFMHFTEIYLEELAKVADGKLQPSRTIDLLRPYINKLAFARDNRIVQWIIKFIFTHLMKQHKLGLEYEDKYKVWRAEGFSGSINQIQKVTVPQAGQDEEVSDLDSESEISIDNKPLDPRAGKVDVELPLILFNAKDISEALLVPKTDSRTSKATRNQLTVWSEKFLKLHNGIYPLGVKRLEPKKRKSSGDIDTNVTRAAKKLIKFEQKLLARELRDIKRKRDISEGHDVGPTLKKNKKINSETETTNEFENTVKVQVKMPNKQLLLSVSSLDKQKKNKALEVKKAKKKISLKRKLKKAISAEMNFDEMNSSIDEFNFCFKRNSGIWYVTPELNAQTVAAKQTPTKSENKQIKNEIANGKHGNHISPKKSTKVKHAQEVAEIISRLRGKSRVSQNNRNSTNSLNALTPKNVESKPGSPKKVVINTRLNVSQEIDDHIWQVMSSPQLPWDSSKKPGKPLLKTPIKASPINPFYKLRRF